jgi:hypothetical protein
MVEAILIGVIVISIVGLLLELIKSESWNPNETKRRISRRRLKDKEERIERRKTRKAGPETNSKI